ncbi:uncharacterized protein ColSpa_11917 [Colletotrichum spaethianum]|uniref:Uncharacterized protein n=1 Tax=Colletotrichum spaethianum TaxID=700344 RepID=A0AA37ULH3_9PEZI|nr:uncharacterized protein ColSpa_11917 [Colletotrichum spaethianum]GKT51736.1 hypothetical protein ColSpa_11917 [Colletotrichum spaethianum]
MNSCYVAQGTAKRSRLYHCDAIPFSFDDPRANEINTEAATRTRKVPSARGWADSYYKMEVEGKAWVILGEHSDGVDAIYEVLAKLRPTLHALCDDLTALSDLSRDNPKRGHILGGIQWAANELRWCFGRLDVVRIADLRAQGQGYTRDHKAMMAMIAKERKEKHVWRFVMQASPKLCKCFAILCGTCGPLTGKAAIDSTVNVRIPFHDGCAPVEPNSQQLHHGANNMTVATDLANARVTGTMAGTDPRSLAIKELREAITYLGMALGG